jgi:hypothetical protein
MIVGTPSRFIATHQDEVFVCYAEHFGRGTAPYAASCTSRVAQLMLPESRVPPLPGTYGLKLTTGIRRALCPVSTPDSFIVHRGT